MNWFAVIKEIVVTLRKWAPAIFAWWSGFNAGKEKAEDVADKAADKARKDHDEKDDEFNRRIRDARRHERLRDALEKDAGDN